MVKNGESGELHPKSRTHGRRPRVCSLPAMFAGCGRSQGDPAGPGESSRGGAGGSRQAEQVSTAHRLSERWCWERKTDSGSGRSGNREAKRAVLTGTFRDGGIQAKV